MASSIHAPKAYSDAQGALWHFTACLNLHIGTNLDEGCLASGIHVHVLTVMPCTLHLHVQDGCVVQCCCNNLFAPATAASSDLTICKIRCTYIAATFD